MTDVSGERLLYVPNETETGDQVGPRRAFEALEADGQLAAYAAFPVSVQAKRHGLDIALQELLSRASNLRPTLVLWQHPGSLDVPQAALERLRGLGGQLVYHEGDIYGRLRKRFPRGARRLAEAADLSFTVGMGAQAAALRRFGAKRIGYVPHNVDLTRFGSPWEPTNERPFDVVIIGNRIGAAFGSSSGIPGAKRRADLSKRLGDLLGGRLALYGRGWDGFVGDQGPIAFEKQEQVARQAWLTVAWDHFDRVPYYFSNRLPISLVSGVAHVTNSQPGYEDLFTDGQELFLTESVRGTVDRVAELLSGRRDALDAVARRGSAFARRYLATPVVYRRLLEMTVASRNGVPLPPPSQWTAGPD